MIIGNLECELEDGLEVKLELDKNPVILKRDGVFNMALLSKPVSTDKAREAAINFAKNVFISYYIPKWLTAKCVKMGMKFSSTGNILRLLAGEKEGMGFTYPVI